MSMKAVYRQMANEEIDPIILRRVIWNALFSLDKGKGKPVALHKINEVSKISKDDIEKMVGITLEMKSVKKVEVPCFTMAHWDALVAKEGEIMQGLCNGTLHSDLWCPSCEGYFKVGDKYVNIDEWEEGSSCDIRYGKQGDKRD